MKIQNGRTSFYQWDLNQKLIVDDLTHNEIHFVSEGDDNALVMRVYEENGRRLVDVPNILLQSDRRLIVYTCSSDDTESHTHIHRKFTVMPRPKPDDYVYTETEVYNFNSKLDKNFGSENAGKMLVIGADGNVVLQDASEIGASIVVKHWTSDDVEGAEQ